MPQEQAGSIQQEQAETTQQEQAGSTQLDGRNRGMRGDASVRPVIAGGFNRDARDAITTEFNREYRESRRLEQEMASDPDAVIRWQESRLRMKTMEPAFLAALPKLCLSRCPYTGELVSGLADVFGTGSPWWRDEETVRAEFEGPATLFAVDGALRLDGVPEDSPYSVMPGPERPFVIPEILSRPEMRAVLHATPMQGGMIWWVAYFAYPMVTDHARINDFARDCYTVRLDSGTRIAYSDLYPESMLDFRLAPWVKTGKLLWISPGDVAMKLHAVTDGCPYLDLPGENRKQMLIGNRKGWLGERSEPVAGSLSPDLDEEMEASFRVGLAFGREDGKNG